MLCRRRATSHLCAWMLLTKQLKVLYFSKAVLPQKSGNCITLDPANIISRHCTSNCFYLEDACARNHHYCPSHAQMQKLRVAVPKHTIWYLTDKYLSGKYQTDNRKDCSLFRKTQNKCSLFSKMPLRTMKEANWSRSINGSHWISWPGQQAFVCCALNLHCSYHFSETRNLQKASVSVYCIAWALIYFLQNQLKNG